jgi:tetratricopeptide (TPR) repeat protein
LTDRLSKLDETGWRDLLEELRGLGLLAEKSHHAPNDLDSHPLVRVHFGSRLREQRREAWKAGHGQLCEYLQTVPKVHQPDTLADMAPLFQAVHHGCQAGRRREVLDEIYSHRIRRKNELYLSRKLGAFGAELGLVANFFELPFERPASDLSDIDTADALITAAFDLRSLGRIREASAPTRVSLQMQIDKGRLRQASISADHLSELQLALGDLSAAISTGKTSVYLADKSGDLVRRITNRTALAEAYHQQGDFLAAQAIFHEVEKIQTEHTSDRLMLYAARGYRFCDLLISIGQSERARTEIVGFYRSTNSKDASQNDDLFSLAFKPLTLGLTALAAGHIEEADIQLNLAVEALRKANATDQMPRGFLARAKFFRSVEEYKRSRRDLDEVMRLSKRCGMRLFACDAHLEYARLALDNGKPDDALDHFNSASSLVDQCGYHRRDPEIKELRKKLGLG